VAAAVAGTSPRKPLSLQTSARRVASPRQHPPAAEEVSVAAAVAGTSPVVSSPGPTSEPVPRATLSAGETCSPPAPTQVRWAPLPLGPMLGETPPARRDGSRVADPRPLHLNRQHRSRHPRTHGTLQPSSCLPPQQPRVHLRLLHCCLSSNCRHGSRLPNQACQDRCFQMHRRAKTTTTAAPSPLAHSKFREAHPDRADAAPSSGIWRSEDQQFHRQHAESATAHLRLAPAKPAPAPADRRHQNDLQKQAEVPSGTVLSSTAHQPWGAGSPHRGQGLRRHRRSTNHSPRSLCCSCHARQTLCLRPSEEPSGARSPQREPAQSRH